MGLLMALWLRKWDRVPLRRYDWEDDDTTPDWYPEDDVSRRFSPGDTANNADPQKQRPGQIGKQLDSSDKPLGDRDQLP